MPPKFDMQAARKHADTGDLMKTTKWLYAALDEIERLQKVISEPVESFGTPELVEWAAGLQKILANFPEEERGQLTFIMSMGCHLEKFAKSWNSPAMTEQAKRIAELEGNLSDHKKIARDLDTDLTKKAKHSDKQRAALKILGKRSGKRGKALIEERARGNYFDDSQECEGYWWDRENTNDYTQNEYRQQARQQLRQEGLL